MAEGTLLASGAKRRKCPQSPQGEQVLPSKGGWKSTPEKQPVQREAGDGRPSG